MCNPVAIGVIGLMVSGASSVVSYSQASDAADAQAAYGRGTYSRNLAIRRQQEQFQLDRYNENKERVFDDVKNKYSEINQRIGQESVVASMEINDIFTQSKSLQSESTASAAEREVAGPTADAILDNIHAHALAGIENVRREQTWRLDSLMNMKDEVEAQGLTRIDSMSPQPIPLPNLPAPVQRPNAMASIMNFGAQALSVYSSYLQNQPTPGAAPTTYATQPVNYGRSNIYGTTGMSYGSWGPIGGFQNYSVAPSWVG